MGKHRRWSDEQLRVAVENSLTAADVLRALGLYVGGANYETVNRRIRDLQLDRSHWLGSGHMRGKPNTSARRRPLEELLRQGTWIPTFKLKKRLLREGALEFGCTMCGLREWLGQPIPLELDHIDGNRENNELANLRLVCPNCHALTPTYRGKNTRYPHIPSIQEILAGIEAAGSITAYAMGKGVCRDTVRYWLKSARVRRISKVEQGILPYVH